jgi:trehalose-6-phosphate synthase
MAIMKVFVKQVNFNYSESLDLWPLFHYILWEESRDGKDEQRNWPEYRQVNYLYAQAVKSVYQKGDISTIVLLML